MKFFVVAFALVCAVSAKPSGWGLGLGLVRANQWGSVGPAGVVTGAGAAGPAGVVNGAGAAGPSGIVNGNGAVGPAGQVNGGWGGALIGRVGIAAPLAVAAPIAAPLGVAGVIGGPIAGIGAWNDGQWRGEGILESGALGVNSGQWRGEGLIESGALGPVAWGKGW